MIYKAYKYRLYPTPEQAKVLDQWFAAVRWVYNAALEQRSTWGRGRNLNAISQAKEINFRTQPGRPGLLDDPELSWIAEAPRDCFDVALQSLDKAFDRFFKKQGGFPSRRTVLENNSLAFSTWKRNKMCARPNVLFGRDCVKIPKIGRIKYNRHKKFYGDLKTSVIVKEAGRYYIVLTVAQPLPVTKHEGGSIGIDLGVARPVALSNGEYAEPDLGLKEQDIRIRAEQRKLSRCKRGSKRRLKQRLHVAALRRKQSARRKSSIHTITTEITRRFSLIAIENLKVKNMTKSGKHKTGLNRAILNVAPFEFRRQLEYKALRTGSTVVAVPPHYTSQTCSDCGSVSKDHRRSQSHFECVDCGHSMNADHNAAINILGALEGPHKTPSEFQQKSATSKAIVSCLQPAPPPLEGNNDNDLVLMCA